MRRLSSFLWGLENTTKTNALTAHKNECVYDFSKIQLINYY